jgi:hypothetical protein
VTLLLVALVAASGGTTWPAPDAIGGALDTIGDADLVLWDGTRVLTSTRMPAAPERVKEALRDPATYRRAVPSFRRANVVESRGAERLIAWELEIPLWNLEGKLWLRPRDDGVDLILVEGDLAPGQFHLGVIADAARARLTIDGQANVREANWIARRLVKRSPLAEPAMTGTAAWVLLRALALETARPGDARRHPSAAPSPPVALDGRALARAALSLPPSLIAGAVRSRRDGRLDRVEVALRSKLAPQEAARRLLEAPRWRALPGWRKVTVHPGPAWEVDTSLPFVDLDATWAVRPGPPLRAQAVDDDARGALLGWDLDADAMAFSLYPRLEKTGYVARKFIEAEPLLEHGLALALAYVDAASLAEALAR